MKKTITAFLSVIFSLIFTASLAFSALAASVTVPKKVCVNGRDVLNFSYNSATKTLTAKEPKMNEEDYAFLDDEGLVIISTMTSGDIPIQNVVLGTYLNSGGTANYVMALGLALSEPVRNGKVTKFVLDTTANSSGTVSHYNFKKNENGDISEVDFDDGDSKYVGQIGYSGSRVDSATFVAENGRTDTYIYRYDGTTDTIKSMDHIDTTNTRSAGTSGASFTTDNMGRITKDYTWELSYNDKNQLVKAVWPNLYPEDDDSDQITNFTYDAAGNCITIDRPKESQTISFSYMII